MSPRTDPRLVAGRVYRTEDFASTSSHPARLAQRLVREGRLVRLGHGLFLAPKLSRFGELPPDETTLIRAFLRRAPFVVTGSDLWNALGLGSTGVAAVPLVYNHTRSGTFALAGRPFRFRRVRFPNKPSSEWAVVDLFENAATAGVDRSELGERLEGALRSGAFDRAVLASMAEKYGAKGTEALIKKVIGKVEGRG